jgi:hypothetical protein
VKSEEREGLARSPPTRSAPASPPLSRLDFAFPRLNGVRGSDPCQPWYCALFFNAGGWEHMGLGLCSAQTWTSVFRAGASRTGFSLGITPYSGERYLAGYGKNPKHFKS